ncbi:MAG: ATP-binding protein [Defluviitaleaceae bacterium]|nr:ATP-binding protein [Defluviitaleaceae bacterium]
MNFPVIVTGCYGAGKTEFCVNYAISLAVIFPPEHSMPEPVKLADMDVMNPYFRSREKAEFLARRGVQVIGNLTGNSGNQDVPAIGGDVLRAVLARDALVVDLAGSSAGLHALAFFREHLTGYELWVVLNAFREESATVDKGLRFIQTAEKVSGLRVTGIVNNSHMLRFTTADDVLRGQELSADVAEKTGIPVKYTFTHTEIYNVIKHELISPALTFNKLIMRDDWL